MVRKQARVMIVDDEQVVCDLLYGELEERGCVCTIAFDGGEALTKLARHDFDIVLLDIRLPGISGMEVLREIRSNHANTATIMITAVKDVDTAVEAMKLGASDYIVKPFELDRVNSSVSSLLESEKLLAETRDYQALSCVANEEENNQDMKDSFSQMNAIAYGVGAKYDLLTGHSKIVTQTTIDIAQRLGIPEKGIQRWAAARTRLDSERASRIKSILDKLGRSPLAQSIMGMTEPHLYTPNPDQSQN